MKIYRRSQVARNLVIYTLGSLLFIRILESIHLGQGPFDLKKSVLRTIEHLWMFWGAFLSIFFIRFGKKLAVYILPTYFIFVFYCGIKIFLIQFDKVILLLSFAHLVFSYLLYTLWSLELKEAVFNPQYHLNNVGKKWLHKLKVVVEIKGVVYSGYLTNWDEFGFFVYFNSEPIVARDIVDIKILFEENTFFAKGEVITKFGQGRGIRVKYGKKSQGLGWRDFFAIIQERGLKSSYI